MFKLNFFNLTLLKLFKHCIEEEVVVTNIVEYFLQSVYTFLVIFLAFS